MTLFPRRRGGGAPHIDPDGLSTVLVCAASRALTGRPCDHPRPDARRWFGDVDHSGADPDPAAWVMGHYLRDRYPAVVVGEPHGAAVHLAVALGAAWLPTTVNLRRTERQPWGRQPAADTSQPNRWAAPVRYDGYRAFVSGRLRRGGTVITIGTDDTDADVSAAEREIGAFASAVGFTTYHIGYGRPAALSAAVADLYRVWLRRAGKTGNRLVIESGRLTDPGQVLRAGLVPYWCPGNSRSDIIDAQVWIAGSQPFTDIEAFPEPPGTLPDEVTTCAAWTAAVAFGQRRGVVDPTCRRAYPLGRVPHLHATSVLATHPHDLPVPPTLHPTEAMLSFHGSDLKVIGV